MSDSFSLLSLRRSEAWILLGTAVLAVVFGMVGYCAPTEQSGGEYDFWSGLYHGIQLLVLNGSSEPNVHHWALHLGRFLGVVVFGWTLGLVLMRYFGADLMRMLRTLRGRHTVVYGLGPHGREIALALKARGASVIGIAFNGEMEASERLPSAGITVISGAEDGRTALRQARSHRALKVIAAAEDDGWNIALGKLLGDRDLIREGTRVIVHVRDHNLRTALNKDIDLPKEVEVYDLEADQQRARRVLRDFPLDFQPLPYRAAGEPKRATLVLLGSGTLASELAQHAARTAHYASGGKTRLVWIDGQLQTRLAPLRGAHPAIWTELDLIEQDCSPADSELMRLLGEHFTRSYNRDEPLQVVVCTDQPTSSRLGLGMRIAQLASKHAPKVRVLVDLESDQALYRLVATSKFIDDHPGLFPIAKSLEEDQAHLFGDDREDELASLFHMRYVEIRKDSEDSVKRPAQLEWERLQETYRLASRAEADHLHIKARAMGCYVGSKSHPGTPPAPVEKAELERLAQLEHVRWMAERRTDGWIHGPERDNSCKIHPLIKPWDQLAKQDQKIDLELVKSMNTVLKDLKEPMAIFRGEDPRLDPSAVLGLQPK